jgi:hypothetical protein
MSTSRPPRKDEPKPITAGPLERPAALSSDDAWPAEKPDDDWDELPVDEIYRRLR